MSRTLSPLTTATSTPEPPARASAMAAWGFPYDPSSPDPARPFLAHADACTYCTRSNYPCHIPPLIPAPGPHRAGLRTMARGPCAACVRDGVACSEDSARRRWFVEVDAGVGFEGEQSDRADRLPDAPVRKFTSMLDTSDDDDDTDANDHLAPSLWSDDEADTNPTPASIPETPLGGAVHPRATIADAPGYHPSAATPTPAPTLGHVIKVLERNAASLAAFDAAYAALLARAEAVVAALGGSG
ncbi:uncharacterized protein LOC62_01G000163 [Vanrija pseudolonga]|uniref:Zn(2)-C6 fungal-type domain-containing protein n=1 Tax=Vanrija pseudolonga TaxID=143232 RepID=A0AAF0Y2P2_9TREE|nr:hypothetical protein LOC62_01G000163 [Vanrija pseudolonga]